MTVMATLEGVVTNAETTGLLLLANVVTAGVPELELTVTNNTELVDAALPEPGTRQDAGFSVYIDDSPVEPRWIAGPVSVRMTTHDLSTWSLTLQIGHGNPFGKMLGSGYLGAPPGLAGVRICGVYRLPDGTIEEIPLITNGIAHASEVSAPGGRTLRIDGVDAGGRYDRNAITLVLPPFHNTDRRDVATMIAEAAGVPSADIEWKDIEGFPLGYGAVPKPVNLVDFQDWMSELRKIWGTVGLVVQWTGDGKLTNESEAWRADVVRGSLTDYNFIEASLQGSLDTPTAVQYTGFTIVEPEAEVVTETVESEVVGPYTAPAIVATINSDCTETPFVESFLPVERTLLRTVITEEVHQSRELLSSVQTSEKYFHRERAHNFLDGGGGLVNCVTPNSRFDDGKVSGEHETFQLVEEIRQVRTFGDDDYILSEVRTVSRFQWIEEYHTDIDGVFNLNNRLDGGRVVTTLDEPYVLAERTTVAYTVVDAVITQEVETLEDYHARPGSGFVYLDGKNSSQAAQSFQAAKITTRAYTALNESQVQTIETAVDYRDDTTTTTVTKENGSLPAAPYLGEIVVQQSELGWKVTSEELMLTRPPYLAKYTADWMTVSNHAKSLARQALRDESAMIFSATMPAMFLIRPPSWWRVFSEATGETVTSHIRFDEVTHEWAGPARPGSPGNPVLTRLSGVKYVVWLDPEEDDVTEPLA